MKNLLPTLFLTFFLPQNGWAETCSEKVWKNYQEKVKGKKLKQDFKVPSLLTLPPVEATNFQEAISLCEVQKIKERLLSHNWKSLCSPEYQRTRIRCFRNFLSRHQIKAPVEIPKLAILAEGAVREERGKNAARNRDVQIYQMLDSILYVYERSDPLHFTVAKMKRLHSLEMNMAFKKLYQKQQDIYSEARSQLLKMIDKNVENLGKGRRPASAGEVKWLNQMRPQMERRIRKLKASDRPWD